MVKLNIMTIIEHLDPDYKKELPEVIYHYTSLDNFIKILKTKTFYLFNSYQMNDYKENMTIIDILNTVIMQKKIIIPDDYLKELYKVLGFKFKMGFAFISCFTELRDSISQWRAYGDDGNGICIIFNPKSFEISYALPSHNAIAEKCVSIHDVIYSKEQQEKIIIEILNMAINNQNTLGTHGKEFFAENVYELIIRFAPIFKMNEFQEEKEWRIIYETVLMGRDHQQITTTDSRKDIEFIHTRNNIKSYFPLNIEENKFVNSLKGIILGPKTIIPDMEIATILENFGFWDIKIFRSNISYRSP